MSRLTGLEAFDWLVVSALAASVALVVRGRTRGADAGPAAGLAPVAAGMVAIVWVIGAWGESVDRWFLAWDWLGMWAVLAIVALASVAIVDLVFARVVPRIAVSPLAVREALVAVPLVALGLIALTVAAARLDGTRPRPSPADRGVISVPTSPVPVTTSPVTVTTSPAMATTTTTPASGTLLREVATVRLDGGPLGMALDEDRDLGYLTMGQGRIVRFSISSVLDGVWDPVVVADGLESPRGIALAGDLLVIAELGPLPCPDPFPLCVGEPVGSNRALGESNLLSGSSGRLVAYTVGGDGALTGRRVLVDGLPVINSHHGVNGVALGSDGKVYASIGSYQQMVFRREVAEAATHPNIDWLGTVLRVDPATGEIDVFASGLRNVFAIAFDDTGALWGVDNDGRTFGSWRAEEVVRIQEGDEFGHPYEGSYGPWSVRTAFAVWHAPTAGSAGVAWGSPIGLDDTLLIGSCGRFDALQMEVIEGEWRVHVETGWTPIVALEGCATAVATVGTDTVLVASVVGTEGVLSGFESNG